MFKKHKKDILIITNILPPYRVPLFNELNYHLGDALEVVFQAKTEQNRQWIAPEQGQFRRKIISKNPVLTPAGYFYGSFMLFWYLIKRNPRVVIVGGFGLPAFLSLIYCKLNRTALILWGEYTLDADSYHNVNKLRKLARYILIRQGDAFVASSSDTKDYFKYYGANEEKIFISLLTVDVENFMKSTAAISLEKLDKIKSELKLKDKKVILYVGRLVDGKGLSFLLQAFSMLAEEIKNVDLLLVGDGPLASELKLECENRSIPERVHFAGFKQIGEIEKYYAIADVFIFPTLSDLFGAVIVEAMASGLPIICSSKAGAARDLVMNGHNGFIIEPADIEQIHHTLKTILENEQLKQEMGKKSRQIIENYTPQKVASGFLDAIKYTMQYKTDKV